MTGYDNFLDAEYDAYCRDRDLAERDFLQEEIAELELSCRESWSVIKFHMEQYSMAIDSMDDELAREHHDIVEYERELLKGYEAEIARLEEELLYLPA